MRDQSRPTVTVVIPTNGGRAEVIARTLPILLEDAATSEVIIAFDGDDPATRRLIEEYVRSDDRIRQVRTDAGSAGDRGQSARDTATRVASGEVVLALDDDVEPEKGLVSGHARRHQSTAADLIVLGYMPVAPDGSKLNGPARLYAEAYERACATFRADDASVLTGLWGGNFSLPRGRWLQASSEGPKVDAGYHVDREFGFRLQKTGIRGVFDPTLRAAHRYQRSCTELLRDAQDSGRARALLHLGYPELVPPASPTSNRAVARPFVWISRSRIGWGVTTRTLLVAARVLASIGLGTAEYAVTRLLWSLGFARGVRKVG
jgi:glycosyltransferase involved in cell wall biosynthesis